MPSISWLGASPVRVAALAEEDTEAGMARVLIAEDDHLMRWSLEKLLGREGHAVHSVDSDKAAINAAKVDGYGVAILNHMSETDDFTTLRWIKTLNPKTHVIIITARATSQMERLARNIGAFDFLEKPFQFGVLRQSVDRAIVTPERRRGPRGCCAGCQWQNPCARWQPLGRFGE